MIYNDDNQDSAGQRRTWEAQTAAAKASLTSRNCRCSSVTTWREVSKVVVELPSIRFNIPTYFKRLHRFCYHPNLCFYGPNNIPWSWQAEYNAFSRLEMSLVLAFIAASAIVKSRSVFSRLPWPTTSGFRTARENGFEHHDNAQYTSQYPIKFIITVITCTITTHDTSICCCNQVLYPFEPGMFPAAAAVPHTAAPCESFPGTPTGRICQNISAGTAEKVA